MIKLWPSLFAKNNPADGLKLPEGGRSSIEEPASLLGGIQRYSTWLDGLSPELPAWVYQFCELVSIINPDLSQAVKNWINIANTGHQIIIEGTDAIIDRAIQRINEIAYSIYQKSAGVDGLLNHYLAQIARMGAVSSEDELNLNLKGVRRVHLIPVRKIRFKYIDGDYKPYQMLTDPFSAPVNNADDNLIPLNEVTYHIYAYQTIENSPYPIPPMLAAIEPVITQREMIKNIQFIAKKLGLLGLVAMSLKAPAKKPNETEAEYKARAESYANDVMTSLQKNFSQGLMVKYDDQTVEHFPITGEARGAKDVFQINEEQVFSGIGTDPAMHGRSYSTTETYAGVVYNILVHYANNFRRLAKRRHESTLRLDLLTMGIPVDGVTMQWNPIPGMNIREKEEAEAVRISNIIRKRDVGIISQEQAAQEMGYDEPWLSDEEIRNMGAVFNQGSAQNTEKKKIRFQFSKHLQQYILVRDHIKLQNAKSPIELTVADDELTNRVRKYLNIVLPFNQAANAKATEVVIKYIREHNFEDFDDEYDFATRITNLAESVVGLAMTDQVVKNKIMTQVAQIFTFYRLQDRSLFDPSSPLSFSFSPVDERALDFLKSIDQFYLGKYIRNTGVHNPVVTFLKEQYLEKGKSLFDREGYEKFRGLFADRLKDLTEAQVRRIINTSVSRIRNWGHVGQLAQAGIKRATYYNPAPIAEICKYLNGTSVSVDSLRAGMETLMVMTPEEYENWLHPIEPAEAASLDDFALSGAGLPPFHPECKTQLVVE